MFTWSGLVKRLPGTKACDLLILGGIGADGMTGLCSSGIVLTQHATFKVKGLDPFPCVALFPGCSEVVRPQKLPWRPNVDDPEV
jgi:hypothetical protein